ncbi:hypothetical protein HanRHA438_Chr03g0126011 [Helianthus annuus]|nr:hypothetical protein HanRHA438_Chr03g0126011 [Helianthus annuus]
MTVSHFIHHHKFCTSPHPLTNSFIFLSLKNIKNTFFFNFIRFEQTISQRPRCRSYTHSFLLKPPNLRIEAIIEALQEKKVRCCSHHIFNSVFRERKLMFWREKQQYSSC